MNALKRIAETTVGVLIAGLILAWHMGAGGVRPGLICQARPGTTQGFWTIECH